MGGSVAPQAPFRVEAREPRSVGDVVCVRVFVCVCVCVCTQNTHKTCMCTGHYDVYLYNIFIQSGANFLFSVHLCDVCVRVCARVLVCIAVHAPGLVARKLTHSPTHTHSVATQVPGQAAQRRQRQAGAGWPGARGQGRRRRRWGGVRVGRKTLFR